jgi:mono/diheme cytochrome c family protein
MKGIGAVRTHWQMGIAIFAALLYGQVILANDLLTGSAERGESVYRTYCVNCHGPKGHGDGPVADSLTPRPADLTTAMVQNKTEKELLMIIRNGKAGTSMPSWKGELSDQHIQDVLAYVRWFKR